MGEWQPPHLHWTLNGEHVLFPFIQLYTFPSYLLASLLLIIICVLERLVTLYHSKTDLSPIVSRRSLWKNALWRCLLYWVAIILRLCYMLAAMTFNMGLLVIMATTLALTQFAIELNSPPPEGSHAFQSIGLAETRRDSDATYLPSAETSSSGGYDTASSATAVPKNRPRSKSKPESIFIHPAQSNIARADAMAHHLHLEERIRSEMDHTDNSLAWQEGRGKEMARQLLHPTAGDGPSAPSHERRDSGKAYTIGDDWDDDDDDDEKDESRRRLITTG